jgi:asparagine N-glycosylation enzyme membrane subunit Stt3
MVATFLFWVRSVRTPGSWWFGLLAGAAQLAMAAAWGGYVFVANMVGLHAALLIALGRYNSGESIGKSRCAVVTRVVFVKFLWCFIWFLLFVHVFISGRSSQVVFSLVAHWPARGHHYSRHWQRSLSLP